jgi:hypothetical protein
LIVLSTSLPILRRGIESGSIWVSLIHSANLLTVTKQHHQLQEAWLVPVIAAW